MQHRVFDPASSDDVRDLDRLNAGGDLTSLDTAAIQFESLGALLDAPSDAADEQPRWVLYPWRRTLVRILGPVGFRRLRLDRNRNKITAEEQRAFGALRIGVVGLSVGHAVAHTLALEGLCGELRLADFDELDLSNLNRVPASVLDLGVNKAVLAARRIAELDPYLDVHTFTDGVTASNVDGFLDGLDIVVEECDSIETKILVRSHARARGIPVLMETSDGGVLDVERFDLDPKRPLFHGLIDDVDVESATGLSPERKTALAARILDPSKLSTRMLASIPEIGRTLSTWPQLGSDVALGGASVAAAVRAFGLGLPLPSGRARIDLDAGIASSIDPSERT